MGTKHFKKRTNCPYAATFWNIYSISPPIYIYNLLCLSILAVGVGDGLARIWRTGSGSSLFDVTHVKLNQSKVIISAGERRPQFLMLVQFTNFQLQYPISIPTRPRVKLVCGSKYLVFTFRKLSDRQLQGLFTVMYR